MEVRTQQVRARPTRAVGRPTVARGGSTWDWEMEIAAAIAMVARDPHYRMVLSGRASAGRVPAELDAAAARAGVVIERRARFGGGWDVVVRAA
jgi:hypothetical protein